MHLASGLVALLPVGAILYVSAVQLGSSSLKDLALALFASVTRRVARTPVDLLAA